MRPQDYVGNQLLGLQCNKICLTIHCIWKRGVERAMHIILCPLYTRMPDNLAYIEERTNFALVNIIQGQSLKEVSTNHAVRSVHVTRHLMQSLL